MNASDIAHHHGFRKSGKTWRGPCPAHGGKKQSLSIWDGEGGSIGAKCHSRGCSYQDIIRSLEVEYTYEGLWYAYGTQKPDGTKGVLRRRGPNKDMTGNFGTNEGLLLKIEQNDQNPEAEVVINEGQKAGDAVKFHGLDGFVSAHWDGGTGAVEKVDFQPVKGRRVILLPDAGPAGLEAMTKAGLLALKAGAAKVRIVDVSHLPENADAADVSEQELARMLKSAEPFTPPTESLPTGMFERSREGTRQALNALQLDLRFDVRTGAAEVRRRDNGSYEALRFNKEAGLDPDPSGWAVLNTNAMAYVRAVWRSTFKDLDGKPYSVAPETLADRLSSLYGAHRVDPFREWLEGLPEWDGVERLDRLFVDALGAQDTPLNKAAARAVMVGAVRRTYEPGCQHDWAPVLVGQQGGGKTTFCANLLPPDYPGWYVSLSNLAQDIQRQVEQIDSAVIVEFGEMGGVHHYRVVKSYLSARSDTYRRPYARTSQRTERRWVGIGTSNDEGTGVLPSDPSGNRRYVTVVVNPPGETREERSNGVRQYLETNREQLWIEALARYKKDERSYIAGEFEDEQDKVNREYTAANEPMAEIAERLTRNYADNDQPRKLAELMIEGGLATDLSDAQSKYRSVGRELAGILWTFNWEKKQQMRDGERSVYWFPPVTTMPQNDRPGYPMVGGGHGAATITHEDICSECNSSVRPKHQPSHPTQARLFDGLDLVALGHAVRVIPLEAIRTTSIMANPQDDAEFREIVSRAQALAEAHGVTFDAMLTHYLAELQIRRDHQYGRQRTLAVGAPRLN